AEVAKRSGEAGRLNGELLLHGDRLYRSPRDQRESSIRLRIAFTNTATSSVFRAVTMPPSSTTGRSTYRAPAFLRSIAIDGQHVMVRPATTAAEIKTWAPWPIAPTGTPPATPS